MDELDDDFLDNDGELALPTMRGEANLDVQDYAHPDGGPDTFLDDDLQEDTPSRPGAGAGPATDIVGTANLDVLDVDESDPGMIQSDYGNHPFGPGDRGSGSGYRPFAMQRTDMNDLSGEPDSEPTGRTDAEEVRRVISEDYAAVMGASRDPQMNPEASNARLDPSTLYDRSSYEYDDDPNNVIGSGIFEMEEGVTWRSRDGEFAHQYALPSYIADEGELDTQQSEMWDSVANEWRVTQPSGGGVTFMRDVPKLKSRAYSPFAQRDMPEMRQPRTGPLSHIEAFGREAAKCVVEEARMYPMSHRSQFLSNAIEALGPKMATRARAVADQLIKLGYNPEAALQDTVAHCVMHATMRDLGDRQKTGGALPRLDRMASQVKANNGKLRSAAAKHLGPLAADPKKLQKDLGSFYQSPAAAGVGEVTAADAGSPSAIAPAQTQQPSTARNLLLGAAVIGAGYLFLTKTDTGKKVTANAKRAWRKATRKQRRRKARA